MGRLPAVLTNCEIHKLAEYKIVTADVPARLQPDLVVDQADRAYALHVFVIETAIEQTSPMRSLSRLEARNIAADHARELGLSGQVLIEAFENGRQRRLHNFPELPQQFAGPGVDAHEAHPDFTILSAFGHDCFCHVRFLQLKSK